MIMILNPSLPLQTTQPPTLRTQDITPWDSPVDGSFLLHDLARLISRHVVLPKWGAETLALWTLHTYTFHLRHVSTYIGLESPEKRCGKTTLLGVLSQLVHRPVVAANISSSAFFRVIEELQPTLLIDEADTFLRGNEEIRGILNAGYTRQTAYVVRVAQSAAVPSSTIERSTLPTARSTLHAPRTASSVSPPGAPKSSPPSGTCPKPSPTAASSSACTEKLPPNPANV